MITGICISLILLGAVGVGVTDLLCFSDMDSDVNFYGAVNLIACIFLVIGICIGFSKIKEVQCPKCDEKTNSWHSVGAGVNYCSECGSKYIVKGEEEDIYDNE